MLAILLWIGAGLWALLFLQFLLNWAFLQDLSKGPPPWLDPWPFVSIVVPARNEEDAIEQAVTSFCRQDYPAFEVIVVDDCSTDRTPAILAELAKRFIHLKVIAGTDPPPGWLGKPHALETGRRAARGAWLLFADADVIYAPDLLRRAVGWAQTKQAAMLALPPRFVTRGVLEAVLLSSVYFVGATVLPLFLINRSRSRYLAVGAGAFNLVRKDALDASGAFSSLKDEVVDDVALGYRVKGAGFPVTMELAGPLIQVRMYRGAMDTVRGFTKNLYPGVRKIPGLLAIPFILGALMSVLPYAGLALSVHSGGISVPALISLVLMHAILGGIALTFKQPWFIAFLNPVREIGWWYILVRSFIVYHRKGIVWRGRRYRPPEP